MLQANESMDCRGDTFFCTFHVIIRFFIMCRRNLSMKKLSLWDLTICLMLSLGCSLERIQERQSSKPEHMDLFSVFV